jgi:glucoamylase
MNNNHGPVNDSKNEGPAPGQPGIPGHWQKADKSGVGTALESSSDVHFTLRRGIVTEVFHPDVDVASIRDLGLLVTDGDSFFSEEQADTDSTIEWLAEGVPAYRLTNTHRGGRYRIVKEVITDPQRNCLLQRIVFEALHGSLDDYHLYVLLNAHLLNQSAGNTAWIGDYRGHPMLFAQREASALAMACSAAWRKRSVGYLGVSDGWQDLQQHKQMKWTWTRAESGNVALTGEIDLSASEGRFVLAVGFGRTSVAAGQRATLSLADGFDTALEGYIQGWQTWYEGVSAMPSVGLHARDLYRTSLAVLRTHESVHFPGGLVASLSVPWGMAHGDNDLGGYHLVWPRDLVEGAGALLAAERRDDSYRVACYLQVTQNSDGHWPQNMWLDGTPYWTGVQIDETAMAILLVDLARREGAMDIAAISRFWPMVRKAASFIVRNGPATKEDRWEEQPGYSVSTLAAEIAGLLCAADLAELNGELEIASFLRETADAWNENIDEWLYARGTSLAHQIGVDGYYIRVAPCPENSATPPIEGQVPLKNRQTWGSIPAVAMVSTDALMLVRFGLRAPDDPRILNTVRVIDSLLRVETPFGPAWHRYNQDGYGEHEDGSPFDGTGIGRAWPLLTGERAHYELAAGHFDAAQALAHAMEFFANEGGMIPEQVWDSADLPDRGLFLGRPTGSANPLVWAHAEYVKLRRSLLDGHVFDMPRQTVHRYLVSRQRARFASWRFTWQPRVVQVGKTLRLELMDAAMVRWGIDGWHDAKEVQTRDTRLGVHVVDLPTSRLSPGQSVQFTFYWTSAKRWEGGNFSVIFQQADGSQQDDTTQSDDAEAEPSIEPRDAEIDEEPSLGEVEDRSEQKRDDQQALQQPNLASLECQSVASPAADQPGLARTEESLAEDRPPVPSPDYIAGSPDQHEGVQEQLCGVSEEAVEQVADRWSNSRRRRADRTIDPLRQEGDCRPGGQDVKEEHSTD